MKAGMTVHDLEELELAYALPIPRPKTLSISQALLLQTS